MLKKEGKNKKNGKARTNSGAGLRSEILIWAHNLTYLCQ